MGTSPRIRSLPAAATAAAALLALSACAAGGSGDAGGGGADETTEAADRTGLPGCYRFRSDASSEALNLPWGVVLDDEPLGDAWPLMARFDDVRRARTATSPTGRADHPFGYWRPVAGDSVEIAHPGGGGLVLTMAPVAGGLEGRGRAAGDVLEPGETPGPRPSRPVSAERVECRR